MRSIRETHAAIKKQTVDIITEGKKLAKLA